MERKERKSNSNTIVHATSRSIQYIHCGHKHASGRMTGVWTRYPTKCGDMKYYLRIGPDESI